MSITGGDPLNSTLRQRLTSFVRQAVHAWTAPPAPSPERAREGLADAALRGVGAVLQHVGELRQQGAQRAARSGGAPPVVTGAGWDVRLDPVLQLDAGQQEIWGSEDAKYGRATTTYGITPQSLATNSATNLTLDRIAEFQSDVDTQGVLYRWADCCFGVNRKDSTIQSAQRARTAPTYRSRIQIGPANSTPLAHAVAAGVRRVVDQIPGFQQAEDNMLSAAAHGYSGLEVVYRTPSDMPVAVSSRRTVTIRDCKTIASLEQVHPRDFRWHPIRRSMALDSGGGRYVNPFTQPDGRPTHKLIYHTSPGMGDPHQRGYDFAAVPLHLLKFQGIARWSVMLEYFGIATPYLVYDGEGYANDPDISSALRFLGLLGRGKPGLLSNKFGGEVKLTPTPTGIDARGQHAAIVGVVNTELLRLVQGQALTSEPGGTGATYALATVQSVSLEDVQVLDAAGASDTLSTQLVVYIVEENVEQFARAFSATPDQIRAVIPRAYRTIDKRMDPTARLNLVIAAKEKLEAKVDVERVCEELAIPLKQDEPADDVPEQSPESPDEDDADDDAGDDEDDAADTEPGSALELTATAQAAIVTVNEAREKMGLPPLAVDGDLTIAEYQAKHAGTVAAASAAESGDTGDAEGGA